MVEHVDFKDIEHVYIAKFRKDGRERFAAFTYDGGVRSDLYEAMVGHGELVEYCTLYDLWNRGEYDD